MTPYQVCQFDESGDLICEEQVIARDYSAVLQQLHDVDNAAQRIEVINPEGESAGEVNVDYWRQKMRRR